MSFHRRGGRADEARRVGSCKCGSVECAGRREITQGNQQFQRWTDRFGLEMIELYDRLRR